MSSPNTPTQPADLFNPSVKSNRIARRVWNGFLTLLVMFGMISGGASIGGFVVLQSERQSRVEEIARLQKANQIALDAALRRADAVVDTAMEAADKADRASDAAEQVAAKAGEAAKSASLAAAKATTAAKTAAPTNARSEVVNEKIREANAKIKGDRK